jgi:hypothetical protein
MNIENIPCYCHILCVTKDMEGKIDKRSMFCVWYYLYFLFLWYNIYIGNTSECYHGTRHVNTSMVPRYAILGYPTAR